MNVTYLHHVDLNNFLKVFALTHYNLSKHLIQSAIVEIACRCICLDTRNSVQK